MNRNKYEEKSREEKMGKRSFQEKTIIRMAFLCCIFAIFVSMKREISVITSSNLKKEEKLPIYSVDTGEKKYVSLTFDAAWGEEDLKQIVEILEKYKIRASFFVTGEWIAKYPEAIKLLSSKGHDIGNHGDNHKHMTQISKEEKIEEIMGAHHKIKALIGKEMTLFRAPYGDYNAELIQAARECGYETIQWDVDSLDWKNYGKEHMIQTVVEHKDLKNGSIILLHNGTQYTKDALETIILGLKEKGYEFLPVSKLIYKEGYRIDPTGRQIRFEK